MRESKFKKEFREFLKKHGFRVHPIENKIGAGMPDLLAIRDGWPTIWIELKTQTSVSASQAAWIQRNPRETVFCAINNQGKIRLTRWGDFDEEWILLFNGKWPIQQADESKFEFYFLTQ